MSEGDALTDRLRVLVRTLVCCLALAGSAAADQCCYHDCGAGWDGKGATGPSPGWTPPLHAFLVSCERANACPASLRTLSCKVLAFKTKDVTCTDARTCSQGLYDGRKGESLLLRLLGDKDVVFVRAADFELSGGRVLKIRPPTR